MNYFSYRISLRKLNHKKDKIIKLYSKLIKEAKKTDADKETEDLYVDEGFEISMIDDNISVLKSNYIIHKADKRSLPLPSQPSENDSNNDLWDRHPGTGEYCLTNKGITEIRDLIRKDKKEALEIFSMWATILIGLMGTLIGLVSMLKLK